ncbi:hypothetical protein HpHA215_09130 [Helicobacter pylori]
MQTLFKEVIPKRYVNGNEMKEKSSNVLDQYFTKPSVALKCFQKACEVIKKYENLDDFIFLEPSAGDGVFYDLFPKNRRIGIDIEPKRDGFIQCDFLNYKLPTHQKVICLGNPPFGHRGVMALEFINHARNCDFVCFILPMFFESQGKGSIKYRVKGLNLLYSERLEKNAFIDFKNKEVDVHCVFQIWSKKYQNKKSEFSWYKNRHKEPFGEYIKVFTVSLAKNRECGKEWIFNQKASFYLSSTFYKSTQIVENFEEVKYKSGIAVVFTSANKALNTKLKKLFKEIDWTKYASLATNSCYHLGKSHIFQAFSKIRDFEANAIGQIGEEFLKSVLNAIDGVINDGIIHDEYDIMTKSGVSFEVKTARKGRTNNTFQFNSINPRYNYDFLICLGACEDKLLYRIFKKDEINYIHKERKYFMKQNEFKKQLVPMNPDNQVNYKLTLNIKELKEITSLIKELERVLGLD